MENIWKELLTYLAKNMETESKFLTTRPITSVEITGLLDKIAELRGITPKTNGEEFNNICDELNI